MSVIAAIQMTSSTEVADNLRTAHRLLTEAARAGAMLIALPENFALMGQHEHDKWAVAETQSGHALGDGPMQTWLHDTARELGVWIVAGTLPMRMPGESRVAAASLLVDDQGALRARYDKIHLFDVDVADATAQYRESASIAPGSQPVCVATPVGKLGMAVCYDMRFPELFRLLAAQGAEVMVLPSAFTVPTGRAHWDVLLRARAIENLCYVLAPAQVGQHANGRVTYGHSLCVDYWGQVLACQAAGEGVVMARLDLTALHRQRQSFPVLQHRRI